jgi:hypothetical protein
MKHQQQKPTKIPYKTTKMKKILFSVFSLFALLMANGQNLTKVKDAITAKKYAEANTQLDEMINNPKYQKNADLFYLKGKIFSEIAVDTNLAKNYPNAVENSLEFFKSCFHRQQQVYHDRYIGRSTGIVQYLCNPLQQGCKRIGCKRI